MRVYFTDDAEAFSRLRERLAAEIEALIEPTPRRYREPMLQYLLFREYSGVCSEIASLPRSDCGWIEALRG